MATVMRQTWDEISRGANSLVPRWLFPTGALLDLRISQSLHTTRGELAGPGDVPCHRPRQWSEGHHPIGRSAAWTSSTTPSSARVWL